MLAPRLEEASGHMRSILALLGENPEREGLVDTPTRFLKALAEMTSGRDEDPALHLRKSFTLDDSEGDVRYDELILSRAIPFVSLCEHHMLPFSGLAYIGYIPEPDAGRVVGLSKLARMLDGYARRFQVQERLTAQVSKAIQQELAPLGSGVIIEATHTCQCYRGVRKNGSMVTSSLCGVLKEAAARAEFISLCRLGA